MGEQMLSREYFYIGTQMSLDRFLSFYYAHPGFHLNNLFIMLSLEMFVLVAFSLGSLNHELIPCLYDKNVPITDDHPEFPVSGLKEQLITGMIDNGFGKEADQLFKLYKKKGAEIEQKIDGKAKSQSAEGKPQSDTMPADEFRPSIILYNKFLHYFLKNDMFEKATEVLNDIIDAGKKDKHLAPDIATWTTVVDMLMKQAKKIGASEEFISQELSKILQAMRDNGIHLNEQAMTMIVTNLSRNPRTAELGWQFFLMMKKGSKKLSTVTYTSVIYSECSCNRMDRALELFREGLEEGIKLRPQYYNLIFKGFSDRSREMLLYALKFCNITFEARYSAIFFLRLLLDIIPRAIASTSVIY